MQPRSLSHLSDRVLTQDLKSLVARDRATTAELLAHLAEFDSRKLHRPAGFSSLFDYCVQELGMSSDAACDRIEAARAARRNPSILPAIADGRLHLTGVVMLAKYLEQAPRLAEDLLRAAERRTKAEIAMLIATRFPREDVPTSLRPVAGATPTPSEAPASNGTSLPVEEAQASCASLESVPERMEFLGNSAISTPNAAPTPAPRPSIAPLSAESYELRCTISREFHERLRRAQDLLSHAVPSGDLVQVLERCVDALLARAEGTGSATAAKPGPGRTPAANALDPRRVPVAMRRLVRKRDGGRCTFLSESGRRCAARKRLECDHIVPLAKGGRTSLDNLRLVCRAHNQHLAERELGAAFMERKRGAAQTRRETQRGHARARASGRAGAGATAAAAALSRAAAPPEAPRDPLDRRHAEIVPFLTGLGYTPAHAQRGAALCDDMAEATLAERVRFAIAQLGPDPDRMTLHAREATG